MGVSSISDSWNAFAQNDKEVEAYQEKVNQGILPLVNGHLLNEEDVLLRKNILDLMCEDKTTLDSSILPLEFMKNAFSRLKELEADGLVQVKDNTIQITQQGRSFIRNISAAIDAKLWKNDLGTSTFSKAI